MHSLKPEADSLALTVQTRLWYELQPRQREGASFLGYTVEVPQSKRKQLKAIQSMQFASVCFSLLSFTGLGEM